MKNTSIILFFAVMILISGYSPNLLSDSHEETDEHLEEHEHEEDQKKVHLHAYFKVYIDDEPVDFSVLIYQLQAKHVHLEDGIGETIHVHEEGVTMGSFFETLDIDFHNNCIMIPAKGSYCNTDDAKLTFFINGIENDEFGNYEIKDQDRILISYGKGDIEKQLKSIRG